jgi:hypothetical protein
MSSQGQENTSMQALGKANAEAGSISMPEYSSQTKGYSLHQQSTGIPQIPSIPASLMIPPSSYSDASTTNSSSVDTVGPQMTIKSSQEQGSVLIISIKQLAL